MYDVAAVTDRTDVVHKANAIASIRTRKPSALSAGATIAMPQNRLSSSGAIVICVWLWIVVLLSHGVVGVLECLLHACIRGP